MGHHVFDGIACGGEVGTRVKLFGVFGEVLARWRLCAIPEEFDTPVEIAAVQRAA